MAAKTLHLQVSEDVDHIPRGGKGGPQNKLRFTYQSFRQHDLAASSPPTRGDTLRKAVAFVLEKCPGAELKYDREYFGV